MLRLSLSKEDTPIKIPLQNIGNNTYVFPKKAYYNQLKEHCEKWIELNQNLSEEMYDHWIDLIINWNTSMTHLGSALKALVDGGSNSKIAHDLHEYSENRTL